MRLVSRVKDKGGSYNGVSGFYFFHAWEKVIKINVNIGGPRRCFMASLCIFIFL